MTEAITVEGLSKAFGTTQALDELDLHVEAGQTHGFMGPNGAGKSTTLRILLGLLRADSGSRRGPRRRSLEGRDRAAPAARVRAGRGESVAEPHGR